MEKDQQESEIIEESLSFGASGVAGKEAPEGRITSDVTLNTVPSMNECSVLIYSFSTVTKMSSDDLRKDDQEEESIHKTSSKAADEEVPNLQHEHKTVQFTERLPVIVGHNMCYYVASLIFFLKCRTLMRKWGLKLRCKD